VSSRLAIDGVGLGLLAIHDLTASLETVNVPIDLDEEERTLHDVERDGVSARAEEQSREASG
jgi:hypothetical protein